MLASGRFCLCLLCLCLYAFLGDQDRDLGISDRPTQGCSLQSLIGLPGLLELGLRRRCCSTAMGDQELSPDEMMNRMKLSSGPRDAWRQGQLKLKKSDDKKRE